MHNIHLNLICLFVEYLNYVQYKLLSKKGEGTFSEVLKAVAIKNGKYYAIKRMKNHFDR